MVVVVRVHKTNGFSGSSTSCIRIHRSGNGRAFFASARPVPQSSFG